MRPWPDVNAIVHTHAPYAKAFAVLRKPIPLVCNEGSPARAMAVLAAEYGISGTAEIAKRVLET
jgi:ribulose-5-phosphate 4-epimerase/fuculose-1-phosphate aldolase